LLVTEHGDGYVVQIWSTDAELVRELLFEDVIYGVCFANERADLLVGFADSIQYVLHQTYAVDVVGKRSWAVVSRSDSDKCV